MFDKSFNDMMKVDISKYVKKRDGNDYLPWTMCKMLLHENGAEKVNFEAVTNPVDNSSLFYSEKEFVDKNGNKNRCYEVEVKICIDNLVFNMRTPVMNGSNPVKDNSMSQQRIWNAQTRAFVKGVAIHTGLGYSLWLDGDLDNGTEEEDLSKHSLWKIKERLQTEYTDALAKGFSVSEIADKLGMTPEEVKAMFAQFDTLQRFEEQLKKL